MMGQRMNPYQSPADTTSTSETESSAQDGNPEYLDVGLEQVGRVLLLGASGGLFGFILWGAMDAPAIRKSFYALRALEWTSSIAPAVFLVVSWRFFRRCERKRIKWLLLAASVLALLFTVVLILMLGGFVRMLTW